MAKQYLRNVVQALLIAPGVIGTPSEDGAEYRKFPAEETPPIIPTRQLVADNMVGDGRAYPKKSKVIQWDPRNIPWNGPLNTTASFKLFRYFLGGAVTTTTVVDNVNDHAIKQLAPGNEPMVTNYVRSLGGEALIHGDVFVQSIEISQEMKNEPRMNCSLGNSGHFKKISDTALDTADIEALAAYVKFDPNKTTLTYSDGVLSYNFASESRLINVSASLAQNVNVEGLPGDPYADSTNECKGSYASSLDIGIQTGQIRAKVYMDNNFDDFDAFAAHRTITDAKLTFKSCEKIGTNSNRNWEFEIHFPKAELNIEPDSENGKSCFVATLTAIEGDVTSGCLVLGRIRQVGTTNVTEGE